MTLFSTSTQTSHKPTDLVPSAMMHQPNENKQNLSDISIITLGSSKEHLVQHSQSNLETIILCWTQLQRDRKLFLIYRSQETRRTMSSFSEAFLSQETMSIKTFWYYTVATEENIKNTYFYV